MNRQPASMRRARGKLFAAAAAVLSIATPFARLARADVWDNTTGNGAWSFASNWADDSEPTSSDNVFFPPGFPNGDALIFMDNSPTETAVGVFFQDNYTLSGTAPTLGNLQLFSPGNIGVDPGKTAAVNSRLHDFVGLTKVGSGTLLLGGTANNFTGTVAISAGTLKPGPNAIGTNPVFISPGGTIEINGTHFTNAMTLNAGNVNGLGFCTWSGTISVGAGTSNLVSGNAGQTFTIGNAADDLTNGASATLVVGGSGALILPFSNNYQGSWQVNSGTLRTGNSGSLGSGTTPVVVSGPGKLEMGLNASVSRGLTLGNGATVNLLNGDASITSATTIAAGANVNFQTSASFATMTIGDSSAGLTGGGGGSSINFSGGGFFVPMFSASTYTGSLIVNGSTLRISADGQLGTATNPVTLTNSLMGIAANSGVVTTNRHITNTGGSVLAATGGSTWNITGLLTSSADIYMQGDGDVKINGAQSYAPGSTLQINGGVGMVALNTDAGSATAKNLSVNVAFSNVTFGSTQHLAALTISNGQIATVATGGDKTIVTTTLSALGKLDLRDNKIITTTAVGSWNGSNYTGVTGMIRQGRNGSTLPLWDGPAGIITSQTTATTGNLHSIGVARASDVRPATASTTANWGGQTITGTDTLVMYTYGGDANLDGKINVDDYIRIDNGLAGNLKGWSNGDFNYDGKINIDDYTTVIDANIFNQNGFVFPTASGMEGVVAIPEPGAGVLAGMAALGLARRRRKRG